MAQCNAIEKIHSTRAEASALSLCLLPGSGEVRALILPVCIGAIVIPFCFLWAWFGGWGLTRSAYKSRAPVSCVFSLHYNVIIIHQVVVRGGGLLTYNTRIPGCSIRRRCTKLPHRSLFRKDSR